MSAGLVPVAAALLVGATAGAHQNSTTTTAEGPVTSQAAPITEQVVDAALTATPAPAPAPEPASVLNGSVPAINFKAYRAAAESMAETSPACAIDWTLIAGIGRVESHHANSGDADDAGQLKNPIFGPTLDGSLAGNQVIADTDGGRLDGDAAYDRAVGPMQFLPSTWQHYAADGNGDGKSDPQNIFDAALTTARYLCDEQTDTRNESSLTTAILRYNNSMEYVSNVLSHARSY